MPALLQAHLDSVVAIERLDGEDEDGNPKFAPVGSGVLVGRPVPLDEIEGEIPEDEEALYVYLVTNWHVIEGNPLIFAKINAGGAAERFPLQFEDENGDPLWFSYDAFDIAVTFIMAKVLREKDAEFIAVPEKFWLTLDQMENEGVGVGDPVSACGFPMGLSGTLKKFAIVRSGAIARLDEEIVAEDNVYLLDCSIFPGNSGGPVFSRPALSSGEPPKLIGIISGYLPYEDVAISSQTGKPRVTFEENSGLAGVVPVDAITGACDACAASSREETGNDNDGTASGRTALSARLAKGASEKALD